MLKLNVVESKISKPHLIGVDIFFVDPVGESEERMDLVRTRAGLYSGMYFNPES